MAGRQMAGIVAAHLPVVPMPPGIVYPDEAVVIRIYAVRRAEFTAALLNVAAAAAAARSVPGRYAMARTTVRSAKKAFAAPACARTLSRRRCALAPRRRVSFTDIYRREILT